MYTRVSDSIATENFAPLDPLKLYLFHFKPFGVTLLAFVVI